MAKKYDFTTLVDRRNTGSLKWQEMKDWNPHVKEEVVPLTVADMEFKNPPEVYEGLAEFFTSEPVLGYTGPNEKFLQAVVNWQEKRHHWQIQPDWIVPTPGVVAAFYTALKCFTKPGDGVIIFRPVYHPFGASIADTNRHEVNVPLIKEGNDYHIDFASFKKAAAEAKNKILIFCSPHNPVGRVWTKEELQQLAEIIVAEKLYVISDEIWYDLISPKHSHTVFATVNPQLKPYLITCTAPSKSFNLAGMMTSSIIIEDDTLRETFKTEIQKSRLSPLNAIGYQATTIVYEKCEAWLEAVNAVIYHNMQLVSDFFKKNYPLIVAPVSEGTYLQWVDFSKLGLDNEELEKFLHEKAQFFTDEGYIFGEEGSGFERINVACPTEVLEKMLNNLLEALKKEFPQK